MIISRTPFRISLAGGGSDIPQYYQQRPGRVVAMSVSLYMYVTLNTRFDDTIRVSYTKLEIVDRVDDLQHDLIRESLRMAGVTRGVEVTTIADVPGGTGLGSSSSLTVGLLNALYAYRGIRMSAAELARRACEIEIDVLGRPIGKQDQFMAAYGGLRHLRFHGNGRVGTRAIRLAAADRARLVEMLLLFYVGGDRDGNLILEDVRRTISSDPGRRRRLDTVVELAHDLAAALERGDFATIGDVVNQSWAAKRGLGGKVSNERLDYLCAAAVEAGASGAKILGAGGGGFLLATCQADRRETVSAAMARLGLRRIAFDLESAGSRIIAAVGRSMKAAAAASGGG